MNLIKLSLITLIGAVSLMSCRDQGKETVVVKETTTVTPVETTTEKKGIMERVGDAVDTRVNNEIDEEIKKIEE